MRSTYIHLGGLETKNPFYPSRICVQERLSRKATYFLYSEVTCVLYGREHTNSFSSHSDVTSNIHWHSHFTFLAEANVRGERLVQSCRLAGNMYVFNTHFLGYVGTVVIHWHFGLGNQDVAAIVAQDLNSELILLRTGVWCNSYNKISRKNKGNRLLITLDLEGTIKIGILKRILKKEERRMQTDFK